MPSKPLLLAMLGLWALSIIGSPIAWLYQSDENIALSINTSEEESGKTVKVDLLEEKLIPVRAFNFVHIWKADALARPFRHPFATSDFFGEIVLPPPEGLPYF